MTETTTPQETSAMSTITDSTITIDLEAVRASVVARIDGEARMVIGASNEYDALVREAKSRALLDWHEAAQETKPLRLLGQAITKAESLAAEYDRLSNTSSTDRFGILKEMAQVTGYREAAAVVALAITSALATA